MSEAPVATHPDLKIFKTKQNEKNLFVGDFPAATPWSGSGAPSSRRFVFICEGLLQW